MVLWRCQINKGCSSTSISESYSKYSQDKYTSYGDG